MNESTQVTYGAGTITAHMNSASATEIAAPDIRFGDYLHALTACFSRKELESVDGGANAVVNMDFLMVEELEDESIKTQFHKAVLDAQKSYGTMHEAFYIEADATKSLDGYDYSELEYFNDDVEMQIDIPLYLVAEGRQYYAMTNVMGVCEIEPDIDTDAVTLSISTHNMPTYLILYQDQKDMLSTKAPIFRIKAQYIFLLAILLLLIIWRVVERRHKA